MLGWALVVVVICLSLAPISVDIAPVEHGDKVEHAVAYGTLMVWFACLYVARPARVGYALGFVALGIILEFLQRETGYREFELLDMAADAAGVIVGFWLAPPRFPNYLAIMERALIYRR
jgi:VanZ family protein